MIDWKAYADQLLQEYEECIIAKTMHNAIDLQLEKDALAASARNLSLKRSLGTDEEVENAIYQFKPKLEQLQQKMVLELLKNGSA